MPPPGNFYYLQILRLHLVHSESHSLFCANFLNISLSLNSVKPRGGEIFARGGRMPPRPPLNAALVLLLLWTIVVGFMCSCIVIDECIFLLCCLVTELWSGLLLYPVVRVYTCLAMMCYPLGGGWLMCRLVATRLLEPV